MKGYLAVFSAVHIPWGISRIPQVIMLLHQFVWLCFSAEAQGSNYMQWAYSSASSPVLLPFGDLRLKVKNPLLLCLIIMLALLLKTFFMPKLCMRLRRKFSFLRVFTGHGKAGKSKKFICQAWIVMELDWPPWKLLVNENSVIEIRYCRCQRKEIACMIEMKNHGTNLIEKQSLCLFDWSTLKRKPITQGKFWEKFTVTASKVIEKVLTFEDLKRVQDWCELSIWQMTVKLKVINIRPCLPGVINASVSEYSSMIFLMYKCTIALLGDHPPPAFAADRPECR